MASFHVIGLGSIGMRHARNLIRLGHDVYGSDIDDERVSLLCRLDNGHAYPVGIKSPKFDATLVCTPTPYHFAGFNQALTESRGAIFIEKPLGDIGQSNIFDKRIQFPVMMGNMLRFHPLVIKAKNWLPSLGQIELAQFYVNQYNDKYNDPVTLNWGSHEIDLARHLLGGMSIQNSMCLLDLCQINCWGLSNNAMGAFVSFSMDYLTWPNRRGFVIVGQDGTIECDLEAGVIKQRGKKERTRYYEAGWNPVYMDEMKALVNLVDGKKVKDYATLEDGIATLKLIEEAASWQAPAAKTKRSAEVKEMAKMQSTLANVGEKRTSTKS